MTGRVEQVLGLLLILIILLDVFLTLLYARIGTSIIGSRVGRLVWIVFRKASKAFGYHITNLAPSMAYSMERLTWQRAV